jgi:ParB-like chromosome segregation protein Spo0J
MGKSEGKKRSEVIAEIMSALGVSKAAVYNTLQISELPQVIKDRIAEGMITSGTVLAITRELKNEDEQVKAVDRAIDNATKSSEVTGKKVKATVKDVKGLKAKSPLARIQEVVAKLEDNNVSNSRANALKALMKALENKTSLSKLYELFV